MDWGSLGVVDIGSLGTSWMMSYPLISYLYYIHVSNVFGIYVSLAFVSNGAEWID